MTDLRLTQDVVEAVEESDAADIRVTQVAAEAVEASAVARIRLTQVVIELIFPAECVTLGPPVVPPTPPSDTGCPVVMAPGLDSEGIGCRVQMGTT